MLCQRQRHMNSFKKFNCVIQYSSSQIFNSLWSVTAAAHTNHFTVLLRLTTDSLVNLLGALSSVPKLPTMLFCVLLKEKSPWESRNCLYCGPNNAQLNCSCSTTDCSEFFQSFVAICELIFLSLGLFLFSSCAPLLLIELCGTMTNDTDGKEAKWRPHSKTAIRNINIKQLTLSWWCC